MKIHDLNEFTSIVDMILTTLSVDDKLCVDITFSGIVVKGDINNLKRARVRDEKCYLTVKYIEDNLSVVCDTSKQLSNWLMDSSSDKVYVSSTSYLSFIEDFTEFEINDIVINSESILESFLDVENNKLDITSFLRYISCNNDDMNIKCTLSNGSRAMTFIYIENLFTRIVKVNSNIIFYINSDSAMKGQFNNYHMYGFSYSSGLPSISTQMELCQKIANDTKCTFKCISS